MADDEGGSDFNVIFRASEYGSSFTAEPHLGDYDPGDLVEIDRAIRHMPLIVKHLQKKANEMLSMIEKSEDFRVITSTGGASRARAYVAPANGGGIHLEAADGVLLKAAASMTGR